ncbi:MAG TPA: Ig-like domain-containing protein [Thermomicrobiales bacterium]|nr:Ig-like domain-containing protein [Thermomicrobiales bacterium]
MDVTGASDPAHGAATLGANDTVRYVSDARYTGPDSFTYTVSDPDGATDTATVNVTVSDTKAPTVVKALPTGKNVSPTANVTALFSEPMAAGTLFGAAAGESATFVLKKGTVKVPATVSYNPGTLTAVLDPDARLRRGSTYTATVTTGAKDEAGTPLDQDPNTAGNQGKVWSFKIKP